ncbi:response regulator transcription factor [Peptostreptococcus porci]|uniref:response regulator transcription factor n=1 Tax=Peptostreptococcus porci TaxID=2652282 RepID=UPI0023F5346B|nr:response regulator transcription factor [Peptostreptococcus porci]MDD7182408.1 response regulator transcription factor [Peptostreptococcus porci]MDY5963446.1 response regulator transcription factor [Peptostreptococcus porci]
MRDRGLIYVADDELEIRELLKRFLEEAGHKVLVFENGELLLEAFERQPADLVILDVMMPGKNGYEICHILRQNSLVPIVFLTAKDNDADFIMGYTSGCDDYFTKPFSPIKLMMRVGAILKRQKLESEQYSEESVLKFEDLEMDVLGKKCSISGEKIKLTKTEWDLLLYLLERKEHAVSREELLNSIWGFGVGVETRATDDTVKRLRKKIAQSNCVKIDTVWGFGFRLSKL